MTANTMPPALSIIMPVARRRTVPAALLTRLRRTFAGTATEILIAGDGTMTGAQVRSLRRWSQGQFVVRVLPSAQRGTCGITQAIRVARGGYLTVISVEQSPSCAGLRLLLAAAQAKGADIAIASSRRAAGESATGYALHLGMRLLAKVAFPERLRRVADPFGEHFVARRALLNGITLCQTGPGVLLEILLRCEWKAVLTLQQKTGAGASLPAQVRQSLTLLPQFVRLAYAVPAAARFWKFCFVGFVTALVNLALLGVALRAHLPLWLAWGIGTEGSIIGNFALNSIITWRDVASTGWLKRFGKFHSAIAFSTALNLAFFTALNMLVHLPLLAQFITLIIGTFVNYWIARRVTFAARQPRMHSPEMSVSSVAFMSGSASE